MLSTLTDDGSVAEIFAINYDLPLLTKGVSKWTCNHLHTVSADESPIISQNLNLEENNPDKLVDNVIGKLHGWKRLCS